MADVCLFVCLCGGFFQAFKVGHQAVVVHASGGLVLVLLLLVVVVVGLYNLLAPSGSGLTLRGL